MGWRLNQTPPFAIDAPLLDCPVGLRPPRNDGGWSRHRERSAAIQRWRLNQTPPFAIDAPLLDCPVGLRPLTIAFVVATWAVLLARRGAGGPRRAS